ncbi:MAG: AEC family transporter, partial [Erysipelotrichaceae bacterium]|nr:AEC family transporter [Erysipelotrichaceae bacterium]
MQSLFIAARAVIPVTLIMILGAFTRKLGTISEKSFKDFNWVVFHYCLPVSLFMNIVNADLSTLSNVSLIIFAIASILIIIGVSMLVTRNSSLPDEKLGVIIQGLFRTNFAILGVPIVEGIYGAGNAAVASVMIAFALPVFNITAVLVLQKYSGKQADLKKTLMNVLKNPLIIGALIGFVFKILRLPLPELAVSTIQTFNKMTTPLSLFVLGGCFNYTSLADNKKLLGIYAVLKMIVVPMIVLTAAVMIGYRGEELVTLLVLFGGPAAISSYTRAVQMGLDGDLASQCVVISTIAVVVTMFLFITGFSALGLL